MPGAIKDFFDQEFEMTVSDHSVRRAGQRFIEGGMEGVRGYMAAGEFIERRRLIEREARMAKTRDVVAVGTIVSAALKKLFF